LRFPNSDPVPPALARSGAGSFFLEPPAEESRMTTDTRAPQAPESYATFWEPIALDRPQAPVPAGNDPRDAYQDFVNMTEDSPVALRAERI